MAAAKWLAKWTYPLQALFAAIGFFIVLLPVLNQPWRGVIESFAPTAWIFYEFSQLKGIALLPLGISLLLMFIIEFNYKSYPAGWDRTKEGGWPNPQQVVEQELYPQSNTEEFVFWADIFLGTIGTTLWLYLPFGVFAYLIKET